MEDAHARVVIGEKNRARLAEAFARFQAEVGSVLSVILDQHELEAKDYALAPDFSELVRKPAREDRPA